MARYSVARIAQLLDLSVPKARAVKRLMDGKLSPDRFKSVEAWVRQCHNEPERDEKVMCALNELLGGFGVEAIRGKHVDNYYFDCVAEYVNKGDTYDVTILWDHVKDSYHITSFGDWVEAKMEEYEIQ